MQPAPDRGFSVDRRVIFLFVFLALLVPMLFPFTLPIRPSPHVRAAYAAIEQAVGRDRPVLMSFDFDPTGAAEQEPMARAMVRHLLGRGGRVVVLGGNLSGQDLHLRMLSDCAQEYGAVPGLDYVYLPFRPGAGKELIISMAQNFASAYPEARDHPLTRDIVSLRDFDYAVVFATGLGYVVNWITFAQGPCGLKLGAALPGQMAPDVYNYLNSGQLTGLLGGLVGAAEYEQMLRADGLDMQRRFSPSDLDAFKMPEIGLKLTGSDRPAFMRHIWDSLPAPQREKLQRTVDAGHDRTDAADKRALAAALNDVAARTDIVGQIELESVSLDAATLALLKSDPAAHAREGEIRRRLFIVQAFGGALPEVRSAGQATRWMTPQAMAHFALVGTLLVANAGFLLRRLRRAKEVAA